MSLPESDRKQLQETITRGVFWGLFAWSLFSVIIYMAFIWIGPRILDTLQRGY